MPDKLTSLGFTDRFAQEATLNPDLHPARVIAKYKELYRVATAESEMLAEYPVKCAMLQSICRTIRQSATL